MWTHPLDFTLPIAAGLPLIYVRGHSNLTQPCHLILTCWLWILSSCFTFTFWSQWVLQLPQTDFTPVWSQRSTVPHEYILVKGFAGHKPALPRALNHPFYQHAGGNMDSPRKGLARGSGTRFHFYPLPICRNTELPENRSKFLQLHSNNSQSRVGRPIAFKLTNSAIWRSIQLSFGRTGVKISEWSSYNSSLA